MKLHRLAQLPEVLTAYPVIKKAATFHGPYAPLPNDTYFRAEQWYLEHRNSSGASTGVGLNIRAAWPFTHGEGIIVGVADTGIELTHPELTNRVTGMPHFNFCTLTNNGLPSGRTAFWAHGTECSGLLAAEFNNSLAMAGVAPEAHLASWVISDTNQNLGQRRPVDGLVPISIECC